MKDDVGIGTSGIGGPDRGSNDRPSVDSAPIMVKKYANRRLYNTATSSYVTLENLSAMVRGGQDFVVQDAKTGEDITRSVLTQIIFDEEAKGRAPLLPTSFLRQIIRLYGDALQGYVPSYLEMTMQAFERNQEAFRGQMERSFGKAPGFAQFDAMARANMEMFRNAMGMFAPFNHPPGANGGFPPQGAVDPSTTPAAGEAVQAAAANGLAPVTANELDDLKRQLAEMQRKVDALARG